MSTLRSGLGHGQNPLSHVQQIGMVSVLRIFTSHALLYAAVFEKHRGPVADKDALTLRAIKAVMLDEVGQEVRKLVKHTMYDETYGDNPEQNEVAQLALSEFADAEAALQAHPDATPATLSRICMEPFWEEVDDNDEDDQSQDPVNPDCQCRICTSMTSADARFNQWEPEDMVSLHLKGILVHQLAAAPDPNDRNESNDTVKT